MMTYLAREVSKIEFQKVRRCKAILTLQQLQCWRLKRFWCKKILRSCVHL